MQSPRRIWLVIAAGLVLVLAVDAGLAASRYDEYHDLDGDQRITELTIPDPVGADRSDHVRVPRAAS
jgi:hypothetical protein